MTKISRQNKTLLFSAALSLGVSLVALSSAAQAQVTLLDNKNGTTLTGDFTGVVGFFGVGNTDFGAGNINTQSPANVVNTPNQRKTDREWLETSDMPALAFSTPSFLGGSFDKGSLYANFSFVGQGTVGDGDAFSSLAVNGLRSTTGNTPWHFDTETMDGGWNSGDTFKDTLGSGAVDFSLGDQSFTAGDGLVIDTGILPGWRRGAYYTSLQTAFQRTAILKLTPDLAPVRVNLFKLENRSNQTVMQGNDNPESKFAGLTAEYYKAGKATKDNPNPPDIWDIDGMYFNIYDSDAPSLAPGSTAGSLSTTADRKGMNVFDARAAGSFLDFWNPDILFHGEFVKENNSNSLNKVDADAWYVEPGYNFENLPWAPTLSVRYAHFSGESNVNGTTKHSYDPLFYGVGPRGYGSWYLGEVYGWYLGGPSNINVWMVNLSSTPTDNTTFGIVFYDFSFASHQLASSTANGIATNSITANHAMDEVDINGSYTPDQFKFLTISSVLGFGIPGKGFDQAASAFAQANGTPTPSTGATMIVGELIATVKF
ncbi:MAG TPA: alginate export family protein [Alphaproteobacteria bacterium]|nr:alginate export family protein [Alphaproteobacteria bacterium]